MDAVTPASDAQAILSLLLSPGAGVVTIHRALGLAHRSGRALHELFGMPAETLASLAPGALAHISQSITHCSGEERERASALLARCEARGIAALAITDSSYPAGLRAALGINAPPLIFVWGAAELLTTPGGAVVGSRTVSEFGQRLAGKCAKALVRAGAVVVSGGAAGVDIAAHYGSLAGGGRTVIVLAQGILTYVPSKPIAEALSTGRACVISEFAPDLEWQTHAAVTRNATISGLSNSVCVIEPKKQSGSVRTARTALHQGKRVLTYVAPTEPQTARALEQAGALPLLDENGYFDEERIADFWRMPPAPPRDQRELFAVASKNTRTGSERDT